MTRASADVTERIGLWGGVLIATGTLASGPLALLVVAASHPQPPWSSGAVFAEHYHPIQALPYLFGFGLVSGFALLTAALHAKAPPELRGRTTAGLIFCAAFVGLISLNYIVQTTFVPGLLQQQPRDDAALAIFAMQNPVSLAWSLEMWGYGLLGVATWLVAPVLTGPRAARVTSRLLAINGPVSIAGGVMTALSPGWVLEPLGILSFGLWNALVLAVGAGAAVVFFRKEGRS